MRRLNCLIPLLLATSLLLSCAVSPHNPQLTTQTVWELNTAAQLQQMERDYRTLFKDAGDAHRAGTLGQADLDKLNLLGYAFKPKYEMAVAEFKLWRSVHSQDAKQRTIVLILEAEKILLDLATVKTNTMIGGK